MKAIDLIYKFDKFVTSNPRNKHNKYISFRIMHKLVEPLKDLEWDEVEPKYNEITEELIRTWKGRKAPSSRSVELAWKGLAYCYEYGVVSKLIPKNSFSKMLPQKPRSGSLIK